jgi:hypothetical protein
MYWGDESKLPIERLKSSVKRFHPELPHEIIKLDVPNNDITNLNRKSEMFDMSPFEETLFLDIDTVVMGRLDYGFQKASQFGMAIAICEAPWARRYTKIFSGDEIEYNTGVIFFTRKASPVFEQWKHLTPKVDSSMLHILNGQPKIMPANDQGPFALAIEKSSFNPFVLPLNWNFRPHSHNSFFGPIKIWHDYNDPPPFFEELNTYYSNQDSVIQYHQG